MPMFDANEDGDNVNMSAYGADAQGGAAGQTSILDQATDVVTKGLPLTGLAIVNSFANTGVEVANLFGADLNKVSVADETPYLSTDGGANLNQYYNEHEQGIEAAGLIAGSLIPGTLGIKALKYGTEALGAVRAAQVGESSGFLARATGLIPSLRQKAIIDGAEATINDSTSLFNNLATEKYKAIALGFGDQAINSLAYETATAATMKASPLTDDQSMGDIAFNMASGALVGGGIGGLIEGIGTRAVFTKMLRRADVASKGQQIYDNMGLGNFAAGDRVNAALSSVNDMVGNDTTGPLTGLGQTFKGLTESAASTAAKKALAPLAEDGDNQLTNALLDVMVKQKATGAISADDQYATFARLNTVQRLTSTTTPEVDTGSFYVNKTAPGNSNASVPLNELISNTADPHPNADFTQKYRLKDASIAPVTATHSDTFVSLAGDTVKKYGSTQDAWDQGADMFINPKGQLLVNPNAPNIAPVAKTGFSRGLSQKEQLSYDTYGKLPDGSQPLLGTKVPDQIGQQELPGANIVNVKTGAETTSAVPTIGDYGGIKVVNGGVQYGTEKAGIKFSAQSVDSPLTTSTATVDASGRYVWAADRGIRNGDALASHDIPMLETLYNAGLKGPEVGTAPVAGQTSFSQVMKGFEDKGVTLDGGKLPSTPTDLLAAIRSAKDNFIHDSLAETPNMSSEELALRANVPEKYLQPGQVADKPQDYIRPVTDHSDLSHVQLWYDVGNLNTNDGQILRGLQDSQYRISLVQAANRSQVANFFGPDYQHFISDATADQVDPQGIGGKFLSSSSSNYATAGQSFERIGRFVSSWAQSRMAGISKTLAPAANALREDPAAAAEAGMFRAVRQRTGETYSFLPADADHTPLGPVAVANKGNIAVLTKSLIANEDGSIGWNSNYIPDGFVDASKLADGSRLEAPVERTQPGLRTFYTLSPKTADWERANQGINDSRIATRNQFNAASGIQKNIKPGTLYTPPLDTSKSPFFALVKARPGSGMADDSVAAITAGSQEELQQKIGQLAPGYSVFTKTGDANSIKAFHEVEGDYQFNRNFASNRVSADIARAGILNDVFPETRGQNIIEDYINWHARQETGLTRDHVELGNGQLFATLRAMGDRFQATGTSLTGQVDANLARQVANPYQSYINTALNISAKEQYRTWNSANEVSESLFSTAFSKARDAFRDYKAGVLPAEDASKVAQEFGLGNVYGAAVDVAKNYYGIANKLPDGQFLSKFVAGANTILGTGIIRLDAWQSLIHAISTPMLAAVEAASARGSAAKYITAMTDPTSGQPVAIPSTAKLIFNAVKNYFDPAVQSKWQDTYHLLGADKTVLGQQREMINQLALPYGNFTQSAALDGLKKAADIGATLTGSNWTNKFNHWLAADVGRQIWEPTGMKDQQLLDQIMTFSNRVQGNYIAGQRPVAFQGPLGQAVGLFQTYYLNLMQNMFRHVENGEGKSLMMLGGLQTSLFGLQGMPGFQAINNHIVGLASGNTQHSDLYSAIGSGLGAGNRDSAGTWHGKLGDYLLYGVTSNWLDAGLYARGDISPRSLTLLPVNPLDFPAIKGGISVVKNIADTAMKIAQGGGVGASLLVGLEHNGLNRPLSGLAQVAQGFATNSQGNVTGFVQGAGSQAASDYFNLSNFSRILGARPLDEAVAQDLTYRNGMYRAKDTARIEALGEAAKTQLYNGGVMDPETTENFARDYAASGGNMKSFGSWMMRATIGANVPAANRTYQTLLNSGRAGNMMTEMGGQMLDTPDYTTLGSTTSQ